jgi:hypothetical protein
MAGPQSRHSLFSWEGLESTDSCRFMSVFDLRLFNHIRIVINASYLTDYFQDITLTFYVIAHGNGLNYFLRLKTIFIVVGDIIQNQITLKD